MGYTGGKAGPGVYQQIINQIPPHRVLVEPFAGQAAVWCAIRPAAKSILVEADPEQAARLRETASTAMVVEGDALSFLSSYTWQGDEFVYCDPPYLFETRSSARPLYACEFGTIEQHRALLALLRSLPCRVAISGYWSWLYELELPDWRTIQFASQRRSGGAGAEWLWMNYPEPVELHDYRYLGSNFRERERIKRRKERWKARFAHLPLLEQRVLLAAIAEVHAEQAGREAL